MAKRTIRWKVEDGFVTGARWHTYTFDDEGFEDMTADEIRDALTAEITDDFHNKVSWNAPDLDKLSAEIASKS